MSLHHATQKQARAAFQGAGVVAMPATQPKRMCIVCHKRAPEVPDRNVMGRPIKRVCLECHGERLRGDLALGMSRILKQREESNKP